MTSNSNINDSLSSSGSWSIGSKIPDAYTFIGENPFEVQQPKVLGKVKTKLAPLLRLLRKGSKAIVARIVIPAAYASPKERKAQKKEKLDFLAEFGKKKDATTEFQQVQLWTHDGAMLDGAVMLQKGDKNDFENGEAEGQKWVIQVNGNLQHYESGLSYMENICHEMNANVLVFNYRGVGESTGHPTKIDDLVIDTATCVQFLLDHGVDENDIIIYGYSIGGGVATKTAALFDGVNLINRNSYSSIGAVGKTLFPIPLVKSVVVKAIKLAEYDLDAAESWDKVTGEKLIVCHFQDKVIPKSSSLYEAIKEQSQDKAEFKAKHIKIKTNMIGYSNYPVVYKDRADMKEKIKFLNANLVLDQLAEDLPKKYSDADLTMPKLPISIEDNEGLEAFKKDLADWIENVTDEDIQGYLEKKLKEITKAKGSIKKIGGHEYYVQFDEEVNSKIAGFAKDVFGDNNEQ